MFVYIQRTLYMMKFDFINENNLNSMLGVCGDKSEFFCGYENYDV